jgi:hypothetical protein
VTLRALAPELEYFIETLAGGATLAAAIDAAAARWSAFDPGRALATVFAWHLVQAVV